MNDLVSDLGSSLVDLVSQVDDLVSEVDDLVSEVALCLWSGREQCYLVPYLMPYLVPGSELGTK
jgi:hypothetical protein